MADNNFHHCSSSKRLTELADIAGASLYDESNPDVVIDDVSSLHDAGKGHISFLDNIKYKNDFKQTKASACIVSNKMLRHAPEGLNLLISSNPYKSYALIAQSFYPENYPEAKISGSAHIDDSAQISKGCIIEAGAVIGVGAQLGKGCWIGANAVIGNNVQLGGKCRIGANATVTHAHLGQNVNVYPGACIGQDGFGFAPDPAGHVKVPQLGRVIIGDNVEIGSNTCIDRGAGPDTIIGAGTWIDNLVQIAHNVKIGKGCIIVSHVGISGSATIEDYVVLAGQVGVAGHITIGMGVQVGAQSGVIKDIAAGEKLLGSPAIPIKDQMRQIITLKKLSSKD